MYGTDCRFEIANLGRGGAAVHLAIPWQTDDNGGQART
jgi:hypothetical protein